MCALWLLVVMSRPYVVEPVMMSRPTMAIVTEVEITEVGEPRPERHSTPSERMTATKTSRRRHRDGSKRRWFTRTGNHQHYDKCGAKCRGQRRG